MSNQSKYENIQRQRLRQLLRIMIKHLQEYSSFGYEIISQQQLDRINECYKYLNRKQYNLKVQQIQLFGQYLTMIGSFILGFTQSMEIVTVFQPIEESLAQCVTKLQRKLRKINISIIQMSEQQIQKQLKGSSLLILQNPNKNLKIRHPNETIQKITNICNKNNIIFIYDQSILDLLAESNFNSISNTRNYILIRSIGNILGVKEIQKHMCIYGDEEIKKRWAENNAKIFKILPSNLSKELVHIMTNPSAIQYQLRKKQNIKENSKIIYNLLKSIQYELQMNFDFQCGYFFIDLFSIKNESIRKKLQESFLVQKITPHQNVRQKLVIIYLDKNKDIFQQEMKEIFSIIPHSKF